MQTNGATVYLTAAYKSSSSSSEARGNNCGLDTERSHRYYRHCLNNEKCAICPHNIYLASLQLHIIPMVIIIIIIVFIKQMWALISQLISRRAYALTCWVLFRF